MGTAGSTPPRDTGAPSEDDQSGTRALVHPMQVVVAMYGSDASGGSSGGQAVYRERVQAGRERSHTVICLGPGQVLVGRTGRRFAVAGDTKEGYVLRSLTFGVDLNGAYPAARIEALVAAGSLRLTDEVVDLDALDEERLILGRVALAKASRAREDDLLEAQGKRTGR